MNSGVASMIVRQAFRKRAGKVLSRVRRSKKDPSHTMPYIIWIDETADESISHHNNSKHNKQLKFLASYVGSVRKAKEAMICSTTKYMYGFMAYLNKEQIASLCEYPRFSSIEDMINSNIDTDECSDSDSERDEGLVRNASKCTTNARTPSDRGIAEGEKTKEVQVDSGREMNSSTCVAKV